MDTDQENGVVVGVDGSEESLRAVRWAAAEAARRKAPLRLVQAFGWVTEHGAGQPGLGDRYRHVLLEQARHVLADAAAVAAREAPGTEVTTHVVEGAAVAVLVAETRHAQLLVVGDRGRTRLTGLLAGSVAVALAAHGRCPVVVARGPEGSPSPGSGGPVVVGVDGTPASDAAVQFAFAAAAARRVPLVAVHAWSDPSMNGLLDTAVDPATAQAQVRRVEVAAQQTLADRLAGWSDKYADVVVRAVVVGDRPVHALLREADGADLVVVGSRGRGQVAGLVLGSVGHALVHRSPCAVAVVRSAVEQP